MVPTLLPTLTNEILSHVSGSLGQVDYGKKGQVDYGKKGQGHVQKRMGTRLRGLESENKRIILSDGKGLGGKNRLSQAVID
ncbi:hypothetical protein J6590_058549 [Homalodisca vitripennis]|nr:hypothetical protein J6590_058549 [Homalodisca vitripennis]